MQSLTRLSELLTTALGAGIAELLRDEQIREIRLNSDGTIWGNPLGHGKFQAPITISPENARTAMPNGPRSIRILQPIIHSSTSHTIFPMC